MPTITPMVVALGPQREKSRFTYMHNFGDKVDIPYVSWLIEGDGRVMLVDAGCSADDYKTHIRGDKPALMLAGERFADVIDSARALRVDVNHLAELAFIRESQGQLVLRALTRQRAAERDPLVAALCPLLAEALPSIGHVAVRNRGTIGGSLAHADPAAELPAVAVALDLEIVVGSVRGSRLVPAPEFFHGPFTTSLEPDELVLEVRAPAAGPRAGSAWLEVARRHGDFALAGRPRSLPSTPTGASPMPGSHLRVSGLPPLTRAHRSLR